MCNALHETMNFGLEAYSLSNLFAHVIVYQEIFFVLIGDAFGVGFTTLFRTRGGNMLRVLQGCCVFRILLPKGANGLAMMALGAALYVQPITAQIPAGRLALGGNVNERFHWATPQILEQTHTTWIRGFIPASEFISGQRSYENDPGLRTLKAAADSGHKIVLSIKWDSAGKGAFGRIPAPNSKEENAAFTFVDRLLDATTDKVSVLVLLNELSIDTLAPDLDPDANGRIPMIEFLKRLAAHVAAEHRVAADGSPLPLFAGGMTRLDKETIQNAPATRAMIAWINSDPRITGADFHMHQPDMETTQIALEFMHEAISSKPLMVTEMSLVWKWQKHMEDSIGVYRAGADFCKKHGLPGKITVAEFLNTTFQRPVPEAEWQEFLASQAWFEGHYLTNLVPMMQAHGVKVATYALTWNPTPQDASGHKPITTKTVPWFLNQLLVPGMAFVPGEHRLPENYELFSDFVRYQSAQR